MAAKKGNQYGKGYGRPPNEGFDNESLDKLGKELLQWMKQADLENRPVVHLSEWFSEIKEIKLSQWESIKHRESFIGYYERARFWMGRRLMTNENLNTAYGSRFLDMYFTDLRAHEKEKSQEKVDYEISKKLESMKQEFSNDSKLDELIQAVKRKG